jgi:hypothetical protein
MLLGGNQFSNDFEDPLDGGKPGCDAAARYRGCGSE